MTFPADWEVKTLDEVGTVTSGKRLPLGSRLLDNPTSTPYIRVTDMRPGTVALSNIKYVPDDVAPLIDRYRIFSEDIFISVAGSLGIAGKVPRELHGANLTENADRITSISCSRDYLLHVLMSPLTQAAINAIRTVGAQPKLALERLRKFVIPLPPNRAEQDAIALALSDVDALLAGLDRLIAKKRDLKQAAMQQLLTGQTRLPGFHDPWESKRLGEIGTFLKGSGVRKDEANSGDRPCIRYGEIYTHHHNCIKEFSSWISVEVASAACRLKQGDLLFAGSGETKEEIGKCVAYLHSAEAYAGGDIVILRPFAADAAFMGYYCNTGSINAQKASKGQGDAVVHISAAALSSIEIALPTVAEQNAIATVLLDVDAELAALEARRDKTRALKQAMTQELLTGRIRLI
ncbi:restriction endonuclease subunit S [Acidovorax sp. GBBC 3334]|uniref:restriction endonuclease subunit S n=1 Tax=Acidovorax sp. GBBC 3334 TaxID=2940496 RepID=UPI00230368D8|nr:restriction endonuclease subunit S [Acidovorax sp. GBBC 3334]MDA8454451.1 restriction endonuclease subunit S [Acidovorax sp. GBBC 3334]